MHGFFYIALFDSDNGKCLIDFKDLTFTKTIYDFDYNKILSDQGISYDDLNNNEEIINLKIELEDLGHSFVYTFVKVEKYHLMVVTDSVYSKLNPLLEKAIIEFDQEIDFDEENQEENQIESEIIENKITSLAIENFSRNFSEYLFPDFLIPERKNNIEKEGEEQEVKQDLNEYLKSKNINQDLFNKIDGTWSIEEFSEEMEIDLNKIHEEFFNMWVNNLIYFRFKYYNWDTLEQTENAKFYLEDGTPENLSLINKYNSAKIIKILQIINSGITFKKLHDQSTITKLRLEKYITELIYRDVIQKRKVIPTIKHISEDLIPLLTLQGFTKNDFQLLEYLEENFRNEKDLGEVALKIQIDPKRIRDIISKVETAISVMN
ncbi:hypothetical protein DSAG12_01248 [Promethearchaeum syntrophicum]|uniref:Uncharacterized protein n=1 Tax=Promethearchaeum syntrophicum TaxID=2594042 RepID=A0A5B9D8N3_9ARCH|nr:hypothetical protein [Candidatus Prometheoarchaeum syntrophicum]QEE15423.1 hypothetical protein DSAG12_01248 [Candidatus Prometheoarchaeum syntrophicum]